MGEKQAVRILVVDDERHILELCRRIFMARGYSVETASTGEEALRIIQKDSFDLLLTDLRMPGGMSGLELIRALKRAKGETPLLVFSGHGTSETIQEALNIGASQFVVKPFTVQELLSAVDTAVKRPS